MYIAEWFDDGKKWSKTFDSELLAKEFAICAYLDCLVVVSIRPIRSLITPR